MNTQHFYKFNGMLYVLFSLVLIITSLPLLKLGFSGDDILNSLIQGVVITKLTTLYDFTKQIIYSWMTAGRFFPIAFISTYYLFYLVGTHVFLFNVIHWLSNLIALGLTCLFLKNFTEKKESILLFCTLFLMCWTSFPGHAYVAFGVLLPLVVSLIMLSLIFYIRHLKSKTLQTGLLSLLFYILALFTYEIAFVIPPIILILNKWNSDTYIKQNAWMTSGMFLITMTYLCGIYYLRQLGPVYSGVSIGGSVSDIAHTFYLQLVGELPLITHVHNHDPISFSSYVLAFLLCSGAFMLSFHLLKRSFPIANAITLLLISLILQLIPALLIGMSTGYQHKLSFGIAHIPVFMQQLGFSMMMMLFINHLMLKSEGWPDKTRLVLRLVVSLLIGYIFAASFFSNQALTETWNGLTRYSRDIYETALADKLLNHLPTNSVILKEALPGTELGWNSTEQRGQLIGRPDILLYDLNGKAPSADILQEGEFKNKLLNALPDKLYFLDFDHLSTSPHSGFVLLAKVAAYDHTTIHELKLNKIKLFYIAQNNQDLEAILAELISKFHIKPTQDLKKTQIKHFPSTGYLNLPQTLIIKYPTDETKT